MVPPDIGSNLRAPEFFPGLRPPEGWAFVSMPEAAMHEDDGMVLCEDKIRSPRTRPSVKAKPKSGFVQEFPHPDFRGGVLRPDSRHIA